MQIELEETKPFETLYEIPVASIDGNATTLTEYRGRVLLIVNVASQCGCTPQYAGLEALYRKHREAGLSVLGFPCDQFLRQEPGDEAEIKSFCTREFGITFPLFAKVSVNGRSAHPLYQFLKSKRAGTLGTRSIKWNFTKFLVDREGNVIERFGPLVKPKSLESELFKLLSQTQINSSQLQS